MAGLLSEKRGEQERAFALEAKRRRIAVMWEEPKRWISLIARLRKAARIGGARSSSKRCGLAFEGERGVMRETTSVVVLPCADYVGHPFVKQGDRISQYPDEEKMHWLPVSACHAGRLADNRTPIGSAEIIYSFFYFY